MANISELVKKNREQLLKEASHRGMDRYSYIYESLSDKELIARIVEHDAYYTGRQDERDKREDRHVHSDTYLQGRVQPDEKPPRTLYRISSSDGDEEHYVRITKEQDRFFDWLLHYDIVNSDCWDISKADNIKVEEP